MITVVVNIDDISGIAVEKTSNTRAHSVSRYRYACVCETVFVIQIEVEQQQNYRYHEYDTTLKHN